MIAKTYIKNNLQILDRKYRSANTTKEALFYSKLAILELCGWIEESMDDIILRCSNRHIKETSNKKYIEKDVIKRTYGFDYDQHFRKMLIQLIGIINVEKLERCADSTKQDRLKSTLNTLKLDRNAEAHTHIKGITRSINSPSITLSQFPAIYDGLTHYESLIKANRY